MTRRCPSGTHPAPQRDPESLRAHLALARHLVPPLVAEAECLQSPWNRPTPLDTLRRKGGPLIVPRLAARTMVELMTASETVESRRDFFLLTFSLLPPERRAGVLDQLEITPIVADVLYVEADREFLLLAEEPSLLRGWAELAEAAAAHLRSDVPSWSLAELQARAMGLHLGLRLALGERPGPLAPVVDLTERLLGRRFGPDSAAVTANIHDPDVPLTVWRACASWASRSGHHLQAIELVDWTLALEASWGLPDGEILTGLLAAEVAEAASSPESALEHLARARGTCKDWGPSSLERLILGRIARLAAAQGRRATAVDALAALERLPLAPAGSLARREERLRTLTEAFLSGEGAAVERAAATLAETGDSWGRWWATRARLDRLRSLLDEETPGWAVAERVAPLARSCRPAPPAFVRAVETLRAGVTAERLSHLEDLLWQIGPETFDAEDRDLDAESSH